MVLKRLSEHEIHSALCPQPPTSHGIGGSSDDIHNDDYENAVGDVNQDNDGDDVIDKDRGLVTGCDSPTEDSWKGLATACSRNTETLSGISAKDDKAKIKSKSVTAGRQNGGQFNENFGNKSISKLHFEFGIDI